MRKKMKRLLAALLAMLMIINVIPEFALDTFAAEASSKNATEFSFLSGSVVDTSGKGVEGVSVLLYNVDENTAMNLCTTNSSGKWTSVEYDVLAGYEYIVRYYKAGYEFSDNYIKCIAKTTTTNVDSVVATEVKLVSDEADYTYTVDSNAGVTTITGYTGNDTAITVPSTLGGYPVTVIAASVFKNHTELTTVALPERLVTIEKDVFYGCIGLKNVYFPNTLINVNNAAFYGCEKIVRIELPDTVQKIAYHSFQNCKELISFRFPIDWTSVEGGTYDAYVFEGCTKLKELVIPEGVTSIGDKLLQGTSSLEKITLPDTLKVIGKYAFAGCTGLKSLDFSNGLQTIDNYAFSECTGFTELVLPDSVTKIGYRAFYKCANLSSINYPKNWETSEGGTYDGWVFEGCTSLKKMVVPENVTKIADYAFDGAVSLESVTLPNSLTEIGIYGFANCSGLKEIKIPSGLKKVGNYAFENCTGLSNIVLPDGLTSIGNYAFNGCTGFTALTLPDSVATIGHRAFYNNTNLSSINYPLSLNSVEGGTYDGNMFEGCSKLTTLEIPEGVKELPVNVLKGCNYLEKVTLPSTLTSIGNNAFTDCTNLKEIELPEKLATIGNYAFSGCVKITSIDVPDGVTKIGYHAFYNCTSLTTFGYPVGLTTVEGGTYDGSIIEGCSKLTSLVIPEGTKTLPYAVFSGCSSLGRVSLPESLTTIERDAFRNCSEMERVWIGENVTTIQQNAFSGCSRLTIHGLEGSYAQEYAIENNIPFSTEKIDYNYAVVSGCVMDEDENGLYGVTVAIYDMDKNAYIHVGCTTGEDGTWQIDDAIIGRTYLISYYKAGYEFSKNDFKYSITEDSVTVETVTATNLNYVCKESDYTYTSDAVKGTATITKYTGSDREIIVPSELGGYQVVAIGDKAFQGNKTLESVALPNGLVSLGKYVFDECANLKDVAFPATLESIGNYAFSGCSAIEEVKLPEGVTEIGYRAFYNCTKLSRINYPLNWETSEGGTYDGYVFEGCTSLKNIVIPEGVVRLADYAFRGTVSLEHVTLPSTLKEIGIYGFANCSGLKEINLPSRLTVIDRNAFENCTGLSDIVLPNGLETIGNYAFTGCSGFTSLKLPDSVTEIGYRAFYNNTNLSSINYPLSLNSVEGGTYDGNMFEGCSKLTTLEIPEGVTSLPVNVLKGCSYLETVALPSTLTTIESDAFSGCINLKEIEFPDNLTTIGNNAFSGCVNIAVVDIPDQVTKIGYHAFYNCTSLVSFGYPVGLTTVEGGTYDGSIVAGCEKLTNVEVPEGVEKLPYSIFAGCQNLVQISLPETLKTIEQNAFNGCTELERIWIGEHVTTIQKNAFANCTQLTIHGVAGSYAQEYATENNIPFSTEELDYNYVVMGGNVKDETGRGLSGVSVAIFEMGKMDYVHVDCMTGEDGTWQIDDAIIGRTYLISYYKAGYEFSKNDFKYSITEDSVTVETVTATNLNYVCKESDYTYTSDAVKGTATITKYTGSDREIIVPSELGGYQVVAIGDKAFQGNKTLESVALPNGLVSLGKYVFDECTNLKDAAFPATLESIGNYAFSGCGAIEEVKLPEGVTAIGYRAFYNCTKLSRINYPLNWETSEGGTYDGYVFEGCTSLKNIVIPEGVVRLADYAFRGTVSLEHVTLPSTLKEIGIYGFANCSGLKEINLPSRLTVLDRNAFENCTGLSDIVLPNGLETIGNYAFTGCSGFTSLKLPDSVTEIGYRAFYNNTNLSSINYPLSLNSVEGGTYDGNMFEGCSKLTTLEIPEGVTSLPVNVLKGCSYLETVALPSTLTTIGGDAFSGCINLKGIELPDNLTTIGNNAFSGCINITTVDFPASVTKIGYHAFNNCTRLNSIVYPIGWTTSEGGTYDGSVFEGCSMLTSIVVPEGVTTLPEYGFSGCDYLRTVELPSTLTTVPREVFNNCKQLRFVRLPESVTSVGKNAFANCSVLRYVYLPNRLCTIEDNAFKNSEKMSLYCEMNSLATVHAIDNDIKYIASDVDTLESVGILDDTVSHYTADMSSINTNGYVSFTMEYNLSEENWNAISNKNVIIKVPTNTELIESSLRLNGNICQKYDYNEKDSKVTIPLTERSGEMKFSVKVIEMTDLKSYALFTYRVSGVTKEEVIGIVNEQMEGFAIYAEELTSAKEILLTGVAPANAQVSISVDGEPTAVVTANKEGSYSTRLLLNTMETEHSFIISGSCENEEGKTLSSQRTVQYRKSAPKLTGFDFYIDNDDTKRVDLYDYYVRGVRPSITHTGSQHPYKFVLTFENAQEIKDLYVTSVRNNVKKSIKAEYDEAKDEFVAIGHFDETNLRYVPGELGVEYNLKHKEMLVNDTMDVTEYKKYISEDVKNGAIIEKTETEDGSFGTIDFSKTNGDMANVILKYSIKTFEVDSEGNSATDYVSMIGKVKNIVGYFVPGVDDSRYLVIMDYRDPSNYIMIVADAADIINTAYEFKVSAVERDNILAPVDLYDTAQGWSQISTVANVLYSTYGIYKDYDQLCDEIMQSSTIENKAEALEKAEELRKDQIGFMLATTILPMVLAGPMAGPALVFSGIIAVMVALSDVFWQLRISEIKGESCKIKWHIDPSGYVYDTDTNERIKDATVTVYCIEYDESEDFWDKKPSENEYGTIWNASEYNQDNPLKTDSDGRYAWDVPEGWWRVKCEKEGYATTWSEWVPVPPVQTEVNIGLTRENQVVRNPFVDVQEAEYYYQPVLWAVAKGITSGVAPDRFAPGDSCTRGQVVTFLWRAHGCPEPKTSTHNFRDLDAGGYYYKAVLWAVENGITSGIAPDQFAPDATVTRGQFVTFLYRAEGKPSYTASNPFTDLEAGGYYYDAVLWAVENGITSGVQPTLFGPEQECIRGQVVTFLYRTYAK